MSENKLVVIDQGVFQAFDRLDDEQIIAEMKGAALQAYVYEFEQDGQKVRGLSKSGTDDASRIMATKYGEALREEELHLEHQDEEAGYFTAKVTRVALKNDGTEIVMDSAIGQKRQAKKTKTGKTNTFWYEQGGQKALRNAKQKLIPETIKQAIIQSYIDQGKVRRVTKQEVITERPQEPDALLQHVQGLRPTQSIPQASPIRYDLRKEMAELVRESVKLGIEHPSGWATFDAEQMKAAVELLRASIEEEKAITSVS